MARYVLLHINDDQEADRLIEDMRDWPDDDLLTPCQEHSVHATLVTEWTAGQLTIVRKALSTTTVTITDKLGER